MEETDKEYKLPAWRVNEIIYQAVRLLNDMEYYKDDFDYRKMIMKYGIRLKKYSALSPESLEKLQAISISIWKEGLCAVFPNKGTNQTCSLIAYNDSKSASEIMTIIMHEFGHIFLKHTEQCINAETEAFCFATAMVLLLTLESQFHLGKNVIEKKGKKFFLKNFEKQLVKQAC